MGRLIDACIVIEKINCAIELLGIASKTAAENEGFQTTIKAYKDVRDAIMREQTAEPERKTGKWIERNPQNSPDCRLIECSECGNAYIVGYNIDYDDWIDGRNFCMKCGADLRGRSAGWV